MAGYNMPSLHNVLRAIEKLDQKVDDLQEGTASSLEQIFREVTGQRNMTASVNLQLATLIVEIGKISEVLSKNGSDFPTPRVNQKRSRARVSKQEDGKNDEVSISSAPPYKRKRPIEVDVDINMLDVCGLSPINMVTSDGNRIEMTETVEVTGGIHQTSSPKTGLRVICQTPGLSISTSDTVGSGALQGTFLSPSNAFPLQSNPNSIGVFTSASQSSDWPSTDENSFIDEPVTSFSSTIDDQVAPRQSIVKNTSEPTEAPPQDDAAKPVEFSQMERDIDNAICKPKLGTEGNPTRNEDRLALSTSNSGDLKTHSIKQRQQGWLYDRDASTPDGPGLSMSESEDASHADSPGDRLCSVSKRQAEMRSDLSLGKAPTFASTFRTPSYGWLVDDETHQEETLRREHTKNSEDMEVTHPHRVNSAPARDEEVRDEGPTQEEWLKFQAEHGMKTDQNRRGTSEESGTTEPESGDVTSDSDDERVTGVRIPNAIAKHASFKPQIPKKPGLPDPVYDQHLHHLPHFYIELRRLQSIKDREKIPDFMEFFWRKGISPVLGNKEIAPNCWRPHSNEALKSNYYLLEGPHQPLMNVIPGRHGLILTPLPEKEVFKDIKCKVPKTSPILLKLVSRKIVYLGHFTQYGAPQKLTRAEREYFLVDSILNHWADVIINVTSNVGKYDPKYLGHLRSFLRGPLLGADPKRCGQSLIPKAMARLSKTDILEALRVAPDAIDDAEPKLTFYWQKVKAVRFDHKFYDKLVESAKLVRQDDKDRKVKKSAERASQKGCVEQRETVDLVSVSPEVLTSQGADGAGNTSEDNSIVVQPWKPKQRTSGTHRSAQEVVGEKTLETDEKKGDQEDDPTSWTPALRKRLTEVIQNLIHSEECACFAKPMDTVLLKIPNHFDFVAEPMDLSTMEVKLRRGSYQSLGDVVADMNMIVSNSVAFNGPDHQNAVMAQNMEMVFHDHLAKLYE